MKVNLKSWTYDISMMSFKNNSALEIFVSKCKLTLDKMLPDRGRDRGNVFCDFYDAFKSQDKPLYDFYHHYPEPHLDENTTVCRGRTLKMKEILRRGLCKEYPNICEAIYVSSSTWDMNNFALKITKEMMKNYHYFVELNEHAVVTIKFHLNQRIGFILFEVGFGVTNPAIVMLDNLEPTVTSMDINDNRRVTFTCLNENYIEANYVQKLNNECTFRMGYYVGGSFQNMNLMGKFSFLGNYEIWYKKTVDHLVAELKLFRGQTSYRIIMWDETRGEHARYQIPLEYFLNIDEKHDSALENVLIKFSQLLELDPINVKLRLTKLAHIQQDKEFVDKLYELKLRLKEDRKKLVGLCQEGSDKERKSGNGAAPTASA